MCKDFLVCFVPLFVAMDALGVLPMYAALTNNLSNERRPRVLMQAGLTALIVAALFIFAGPQILGFLGLTVPDFMIAGGILLLVISLSDLMTGEKRQRGIDPETVGAVPLGVPLMVGPAVLTTCVVQAHTFGVYVTFAALLANVALAVLIFRHSERVMRAFGQAGNRALSKIASLLLAAIAVMLIRRGVQTILQG